MKSFKRICSTIGLVVLCCGSLFAQETLVLTLDQSLEIALDRSYSIQSLQQYVIAAERNLWAAKAAYNTNVTANLYAPEYDEGFTLIDQVQGNPVAKQYGSFQVRGQFDIRQPMPWLPLGGGDFIFRSEAYQLNSWTPSFQDPDVDIKSNKFFTSLSAIFEKPLFTINEVALELEQAELNYERQTRFFKRSELDLIYNVTAAFYQFYQRSQTVEINRESVQRQEEIYRTTKNKYDAGLIAEVDAMQAEVDLIQYQNELKTAEGRLQEQEAAFKQLIGVPLSYIVSVVTDLETQSVSIDPQRAVALALENRSEIVEKKIDIENAKIDIRQIDARVSVKGNLTGYYRLAGFSSADFPWGTPTDVLLESSWEVLKQTPNKGLTFTLEIPIWDWGRNKAQVQSQEAALRREELTLTDLCIEIEREVNDVVRKVYEAYDRVQMLSKSKDVSQRSYEISIQRFANGDITSVELARASDQLNTAKMSYLSAYNEYKLALADLKRKTLYDFEKDQSLVETD